MCNKEIGKQFELESRDFILEWKKTENHPLTKIVLDYLHKKNLDPHKIKDVHWVGGNNALQNMTGITGGNPSDLLIEFDDKSYVGLSLKSHNKKRKIVLKNPGLYKVGEYLDINYRNICNKKTGEIIEKYKLNISSKGRKDQIRSDKALSKNILKDSNEFLGCILNDKKFGICSNYIRKSHKENVDHILNYWMNADEEVIPYIIIIRDNNDYQYEDPLEMDCRKILIKSKALTWKSSGNSVIIRDEKDLNIMRIRIKFAGQPFASSIKFSGEMV